MMITSGGELFLCRPRSPTICWLTLKSQTQDIYVMNLLLYVELCSSHDNSAEVLCDSQNCTISMSLKSVLHIKETQH